MEMTFKALPAPDDLRIEELGGYLMMLMEAPDSPFRVSKDAPMIMCQVLEPGLLKRSEPPEQEEMGYRLVIMADPNFIMHIFEALERFKDREMTENPDLGDKRGNPKKVNPSPKMKLRTVYQKMEQQNMTIQSVTMADGEDFHGFFCFLRTKFTIEQFIKEMSSPSSEHPAVTDGV
ncbi:hypothetical protein [Cerasicoccus fimbriatus]|uniref:hypothetical protein n=1 Tax=Cerasicoccus fimbriatus TaxID=3014554 RepID=UPI0022B4F42A|nr:hypothetical protein [Cerasicoccus sp. TK19100]